MKDEWEKGETRATGCTQEARRGNTGQFREKRRMSFSATKLLYHKNCFNLIPQWALKRQLRNNCSQVNQNENLMLNPTAS